LRYGGNTPCVEVRTRGGGLIILDCGSGIRELGNWLLSHDKMPLTGYIFLTHAHWDHVQGFPFFAPAFIPGNRLRIFGPENLELRLEAALAGQMEFQYFPITLEKMEATIELAEIRPGRHSFEDFTVQAVEVHHTTPCLAYRIESGGASVVYASDVEPGHDGDYSALGRGFPGSSASDLRLLELARGADLLIHDAQYVLEDFPRKKGWGHSPCEFATHLGLAAGARRLALFHHDPAHEDPEIDAMVERCRGIVRAAGASMEVFGASEGEVIPLP
jgi:phosphoribosyl 1,2-cyclic phosphodiesterase